jgi:hypothetical protein
VPSQLVAPQTPPTHAAVQHSPVTATSQTPDAHWLLAVHAPPFAVWTQVPDAPGFWQTKPVPSQSLLEAHAVLHAVGLAQTKPPWQAAVTPATHAPLPLQAPALVSWPLLHDAPPQGIPEATCSHTPPAAQLPVSPQGGLAAHWPVGAAVPAVTDAQVPSDEPVSAIVHAWQVPVQAVLQQTPSTQKPLAHWAPSPPVHVAPLACPRVHTPLSQYLPAAQPASFTQATHLSPVQSPLAQSVGTRQSFVLAQGRHEGPPQSTSVSVPSWMPSVQVGATHLLLRQTSGEVQSVVTSHPTHLPAPLQTLPPPSVHAVSAAAFEVPQVLAAQVLVMHVVAWASQSVGATQPTHLPLPSQATPPLSLHEVSTGAFVSMHALLVQVAVTQRVVIEQSAATLHATQLPLPSQVLPPWSAHGVSIARFVVVHVAFVPHEAETQVVSGTGQSVVGSVHAPPELVLAPPAPPVLEGIRLRSTVATSSQPVTLAASMPTATARAAKKLVLWLIPVPLRTA